VHALLQFTAPCGVVPHSQAHVSGFSTRVGPHCCPRSHVHVHVSVSHAKPGAHVASASQTQAQAASSQVSPKPQPPQPGLHSSTHVVVLHRSFAAMLAAPQSLGHW
jgi:hypothetical protein